MNSGANTRHIAAGDLVRFLHRELDAAGREAVLAHVQACTRCAERLAETEERLNEVSASLDELQVPAPDPARRAQAWAEIQRASLRNRQPRQVVRRSEPNRALRAAAVVALLVAAAFTADPVRAWVADAWASLYGGTAESELATAAEPVPIRVRNAVVGFVPERDEFVLELRSRQAIGSLHLRIEDGRTTASARLIGDDEVEVVVLPGGFRIDNASSHQNDYVVSVPATVASVAIHVESGLVLRLDVSSMSLPWDGVIDIGATTGSPESTPDTP